MDWSATLALRTSKTKQYVPNYGSFQTAADTPLATPVAPQPVFKRTPSGHVRIPQSIPENACVVQFTSPRKQQLAAQVTEYYCEFATPVKSLADATHSDKDGDGDGDPASHGAYEPKHIAGGTSLLGERVRQMLLRPTPPPPVPRTKQANPRAVTYAWPLDGYQASAVHAASATASVTATSASSSRSAAWNPNTAATVTATAARAACGDDHQQQNNYWIQKRERLRAKHERRRATQTSQKRASPTGSVAGTAAAATVETEQPTPAWKTALLFCSVPLVLVVVFLIFILCSQPRVATALEKLISSNDARPQFHPTQLRTQPLSP